MLDVSAAYTAAIKDKNRTDRIAGTIKLCDGETINITDDIIVNNSVTLKEQLVSGDTFEIGTFYTNQLDITVYDDNFLTRTYANARITPKYEIQLADGTWESVPLGVFTVDNSLTKRKGSIHKLTAFDDSTRFDVNISAYAGGRKTVQQHIKDAAADVGIELATTDFGAYPNDNLTVDSTISTEIQTYRDLIEWCCAIMAASARINRYGKLEIVKLKEKTTTVDDALIYDPDYTVEGYERTGTEFFDLRALTKYFSTTFDGEQYVYTNISTLDDSAARKATLYIPENPLLQSLSIETRKSAFQSCADAMTIALRRVEFSFNGNPAIECFDTLCGSGGKIDVNRTIAFFPTTLVWKYRGAHKVSCAFAELTDEATATVLEMTLASNEQSKTPVQVKSKTEKRLDGVGKKATSGGNDGVGKYTNSDKNCEIFNDYSGNKAESYYAHAEGSKTAATAPYSHAEGRETTASNESAHAEGMNTFAMGRCAHAEGMGTVASGSNSHASGYYTVAGSEHMTAMGRYNSTTSNALLVIGNGYGEDRRSNALVVDDAGNLYISGALNAAGGTGIDLSEYLKSDEISDWAKAESKPVYTAEEVGAAEKNHTHNMSDITDMPEWTKTENKPAYTASEVGAATAADITAAVNAIEIGGRNLLYDSTGNIKDGWSSNTVVNVGGGISGNSLAVSRTGYSGNARYFGLSKRHFLTDFNVGTSYTLSAWIKVRSDVGLDASGYVMARFRSADDKKLYALSLTVSSQTEKDKWLYYEKTWTINDSDIAKLECVALALDKNGMIEACNIKLEKGTKATDWSPAVEEDTERIASLEARVAALEAMAVSGGEV